MSAISDVHTISVYDSKKPAEAEIGQVLVISRGNAKSNTVSICASLPPITTDEISANLNALMPSIQNMISLERSKILRGYESKGEVRTEQINLVAVIDSLKAEESLTKESIASWMAQENNLQTLRAAFAAKFHWQDTLTTEQNKKLDQLSNALRDKFSELAGNRTTWSEKEQTVARSYLDVFEDSYMKDRLLNRLQKMSEKKQDNLMEDLGF